MREEGKGIRERGTRKAELWLALAVVAVGAVIVAAFVLKNGEAVSRPLEQKETSASRIAAAVPSKGAADLPERSGREIGRASPVAGEIAPHSDETEDKEESAESDSNEELQTEDEKREAEEEMLVNAFDDLTDKWQEPSAKGVTMADIDNFAKSFRTIPKERRDECIHRALNLIPDENVMLLAGVLMDKTMDKEIVETVYDDILNRDEDVKEPILQQIFKDKTHPCWADTAWILDVTGELPKAK